MTGRTVVITGASSGIGAVAARRFADLGADVVPVGRSPERTARVAAQLGTEPLVADFAHLEHVKDLAAALLERCPRIDVLANNAGGLVAARQVTADGHELTFQANHLAPFLLTTLLLPRLRASARDARVRIVTTSSLGNRFGRLRMDDLEWEKRRYGGGWIAYATSKLMNVLFTRELARRTEGTGIDAVCFHPKPAPRGTRAPIRRMGAPTRFADGSPTVRVINRTPLRMLQLNDEGGAEPLVWLATTPEIEGANGAYYDGFTRGAKVNPQADDRELALALWERSHALVEAYL
ncbi:SDR family NAD(P)-dependent oxidoreductase [Actinomadura alba]|uniref:SDR family NAD(P)-dependent oxidoreductase n=2 Tax=Actinomadura alba TaxID=406431 RepID=A0ABR7LNG7_9ACTN|nr:SDR family NAD(P)-dependent oxidoreductase [Actinomadura alba]